VVGQAFCSSLMQLVLTFDKEEFKKKRVS